ncbi:MAG: PilZ domain-containing protein [Pirellulales bacterium]
MLDIDVDHSELIETRWSALKSKVVLPGNEHAFMSRTGRLPSKEDSRRRYHRYFARTKALLHVDGNTHGVYLRDLSRCGIGFLAPVQLLPRQSVELELADGRRLALQNVRCRRLGPQWYECGATFVVPTAEAQH